jgi:uncharacterized Fe-S radical SAM superfamily protein PflX
MKNLIIEPTENTPAVKFLIDGRLSIEGRSLPNNVPAFYHPLIEWVKNIKVETVVMDINLEYYNSISSKKLLEIMKILDAKNCLKEFIVKWHYEIEDEESLEKGEIFEEKLKTAKFIYRPC